MTRKIIVPMFLGLLMILASFLFVGLPVDFLKPNLPVAFVVFTCIFVNPSTSLSLSLFSGFLEEFFSCAPHGSLIFLNVSVFLLVFFLKKRIYLGTRNSFVMICGLSSVFQSLLFLVLSFLVRGETKGVSYIFLCLLPDFILTVAFSYVLFPLFSRIYGMGGLQS